MKLKFMLVPLAIFGLAVGSYANCSKDEIMKLIDKGFSKTEINEICEKSESKKEKSKWINPSPKICKANGGKMDDSICESRWSNAKNICSASGGRLATIDELKKVITDCGGIIGDSENNTVNSAYFDCYKKKGFSNYYWSSTTGGTNKTLIIGFYAGHTRNHTRLDTLAVRCVRIGE